MPSKTKSKSSLRNSRTWPRTRPPQRKRRSWRTDRTSTRRSSPAANILGKKTMARISRLLVLGALALLGNSQFSPAAEGNLNLAAARVARPQILVIAHRGDSKVAPENTLPAFASAVKAGADLVELDYYHSADGVPMVIHDA